ncbi:pantetheinase-like [Actinia tenebrosa]|uniref:Pantetheinase-like n=1 Tax=Actinia tenebrosa TaxID=6105 RepID=A0A6P8IAC2_ACTTE|nr:pantetheinase-like [Actinia tenebrosa]
MISITCGSSWYWQVNSAFHPPPKSTKMWASQFIFILLSLFATGAFAISNRDTKFVAAVYEHVFIAAENKSVVLSKQDAVAIVMRNMDIYESQMEKAKQKNASIIVFPEYGLTGFSYTRKSFKPFLEDIPDPTKIAWNPCQNPQTNHSTPILYRLSCLAKRYDMYVVVNMGDIKPCLTKTDQYCPTDGRYQYNTNIAFDNRGKLVARYHKQHPFMVEMEVINVPRFPEYISFDTPFGKIGTFICFDVLFYDPAVTLVNKHEIDHVVFPTAWFDVLPLFSAIGFHGSWARGMQVNFLAANTHVPPYLNTGSGIYSPNGVKSYYRSLSENGSLSIATLSKKPRDNLQNTSTGNTEKFKEVKNNEDSFYSDLFGDVFLFRELKESEGRLDVCYNKSEVCCGLSYKMKTKRADEMYALGVFDGLHTKEGQYYLRICTLIKCHGLDRKTCGQRTYNARTIFESFTLKSQLNTRYVFPQVVADGVSLLPGQWEHDRPVTYLKSKHQLSQSLLTAALFGRVYELDVNKSVPSSGAHMINNVILICILVLLGSFESSNIYVIYYFRSFEQFEKEFIYK